MHIQDVPWEVKNIGSLPHCSHPHHLPFPWCPALSPPSLTSLGSIPLQVTIEVVEDLQAQVEMDLLAEPSSRGLQGASSWQPTKELFWPLFWGYTEGEEVGSSLKGSVPGDEEDYPSEYSEEEEEEEDYPLEYRESEAQESNDEEDDDREKAGFSGAIGGWEQGWPAPRNWDFKLLDSYGETPILASRAAAPRGLEWK